MRRNLQVLSLIFLMCVVGFSVSPIKILDANSPGDYSDKKIGDSIRIASIPGVTFIKENKENFITDNTTNSSIEKNISKEVDKKIFVSDVQFMKFSGSANYFIVGDLDSLKLIDFKYSDFYSFDYDIDLEASPLSAVSSKDDKFIVVLFEDSNNKYISVYKKAYNVNNQENITYKKDSFFSINKSSKNLKMNSNNTFIFYQTDKNINLIRFGDEKALEALHHDSNVLDYGFYKRRDDSLEDIITLTSKKDICIWRRNSNKYHRLETINSGIKEDIIDFFVDYNDGVVFIVYKKDNGRIVLFSLNLNNRKRNIIDVFGQEKSQIKYKFYYESTTNSFFIINDKINIFNLDSPETADLIKNKKIISKKLKNPNVPFFDITSNRETSNEAILLVGYHDEQSLFIWNANNDNIENIYKRWNIVPIYDIEFIGENKIAVLYNDSSIRVWDCNSGKQVYKMNTDQVITDILYLKKQGYLVTASKQGKIETYKINNKTGELLKNNLEDRVNNSVITCLKESGFANYFYVTTEDENNSGSVIVYQLINKSLRKTSEVKLHGVIHSIAIKKTNEKLEEVRTGTWCITYHLTFDGNELRDTKTSYTVANGQNINALIYCEEPGIFVSGITQDKKRRTPLFWFSKQSKWVQNQPHEEYSSLINNNHIDDINELLYADDGYLISCGIDGCIKKWKFNDNKNVFEFCGNFYDSSFNEDSKNPAHKDSVNSIALSESGNWLASVSSDGKIKIWDFKKQKLLGTLITYRVNYFTENYYSYKPNGTWTSEHPEFLIGNIFKETIGFYVKKPDTSKFTSFLGIYGESKQPTITAFEIIIDGVNQSLDNKEIAEISVAATETKTVISCKDDTGIAKLSLIMNNKNTIEKKYKDHNKEIFESFKLTETGTYSVYIEDPFGNYIKRSFIVKPKSEDLWIEGDKNKSYKASIITRDSVYIEEIGWISKNRVNLRIPGNLLKNKLKKEMSNLDCTYFSESSYNRRENDAGLLVIKYPRIANPPKTEIEFQIHKIRENGDIDKNSRLKSFFNSKSNNFKQESYLINVGKNTKLKIYDSKNYDEKYDDSVRYFEDFLSWKVDLEDLNTSFSKKISSEEIFYVIRSINVRYIFQNVENNNTQYIKNIISSEIDLNIYESWIIRIIKLHKSTFIALISFAAVIIAALIKRKSS